MRSLATYRSKRDFGRTPEPQGTSGGAGAGLRYSCQQHAATRLHWDLRLEHQGVLLSWAVTRGPSLDPKDKRLAVRTEDHPQSYLRFEGVIPEGNYGAGTVLLWDIGWWQPFHDVDEGLKSGHLHFALHGRRATGAWTLVRMKPRDAADAKRENWLMIKEEDAAATGRALIRPEKSTGIDSGRSPGEIAAGAPPRPRFRPRVRAAPRFRAPQFAELRDAPPAGDGWWHEVKLDGYRALVAVGKGGPRLFTRNGLDWSDRFDELLPWFDALPCESALIDGEVVAGAGLQGFGALQDAITAGGPFLFYAFDLLGLDGRDLAATPLSGRRAALEKLFAGVLPRGALRLSPVLDGDGADLLARLCQAGGEGLVSKLAAAPYRSGRGPAWIKAKCARRDEFVIVGYQDSDKRGRNFASLLLAGRDEGRLVYRGKVASGFDDDDQTGLWADLQRLGVPRSPLAKPPADVPRAHWLAPRLVAEVRYAEITAQGRLRHPVFIGLREDKTPEELHMDQDDTRPPVAGIGISHPARAIFPKPRVTKLDLARYYDAMAGRMLPDVARRPLSLLRLPDGIDGEQFFQKHPGKGFPDAIRSFDAPGAKSGTDVRMYVESAAGLVAAVQFGTVEFHIAGARVDHPDRPDRMVFDLDPDEGVGFAAVRSAAVLIRDRLAAVGLPSWAMVSGGKGVHVVVPLLPEAGRETVTLFARAFAGWLAEAEPGRFTSKLSKEARRGRIFVDWLRNENEGTAVAPFSVRARPGAPVAVPVAWDELARLRRPNGFTMKAALGRGWDEVGLPAPAALTADTVARLERAQG